MIGSPPRVRGKRVQLRVSSPDTRITPARAGKTSQSCLTPAKLRDHPRACGENLNSDKEVTEWRGSPPRVRGKPVVKFGELAAIRITPARAGKTFRVQNGRLSIQDHPRACGENGVEWQALALCVGSPPRVRGKRPINRQGPAR